MYFYITFFQLKILCFRVDILFCYFQIVTFIWHGGSSIDQEGTHESQVDKGGWGFPLTLPAGNVQPFYKKDGTLYKI